MSDKASPAGWVVQVTTLHKEGTPTFAFFNVAVRGIDQALEAVRKQSRVKPTDKVYAVRALTAGELATLKIKTGEVKPA